MHYITPKLKRLVYLYCRPEYKVQNASNNKSSNNKKTTARENISFSVYVFVTVKSVFVVLCVMWIISVARYVIGNSHLECVGCTREDVNMNNYNSLTQKIEIGFWLMMHFLTRFSAFILLL